MVLCLFLFIGCGNDRSAQSEAHAWQPSLGGDNCWKCHNSWNVDSNGGERNEGEPKWLGSNNIANKISYGLIPDKWFGEGSPYLCTEYLCDSLGADCVFQIDAEKGPMCLDIPSNGNNRPFISFESIEHEGTGIGEEKNADAVILKGDLPWGSNLVFNFQTLNLQNNLELPSSCYYTQNPLASIEGGNIEESSLLAAKGGTAINHKFEITGLDNDDVSKSKEYQYYFACSYQGEQEGLVWSGSLFTLKFSVAPAVDLTHPIIVETIPSEGVFKFNETSPKISLIVKDPNPVENCYWSNDSSIMTVEGMNKEGGCFKLPGSALQKCDFNLENVTNVTQTYYLKCVDSEGNVDNFSPGKAYDVKFTQPLEFDSLECEHFGENLCNGTVHEPFINISIRTEGGVNNGQSRCDYLSSNGYESFQETNQSNSPLSKQKGYGLKEGPNPLGFRCVDNIGNEVEFESEIFREIDLDPPFIEKMYLSESGGLKLVNIKVDEEESYCKYYENESSSFDDAILMQSNDLGTIHSTSYSNKGSLLVECRDNWKNSVGKYNIHVLKEHYEISLNTEN